jgi:TetR/AcrR family transcriptional regulator, acrAB operon repressor
VRRTKEEAAATREQLLDAAERVFRARGVTRTTLAQIAAAAGVTRGAVYWHFRDKADLFEAMCARATSPLEAMLERADGALEDPLATLRTLCVDALTYLATQSRAQAFFEIVFHKSELVGELEPVAGRHERDCSDARNRVEAVLRRAVAQRQLPHDTDTALATHIVHGFVTGVMNEWVLAPASYDLARAAPAMVDAVIAGLRAHPPRRRASSAATRRAKGSSAPGRR